MSGMLTGISGGILRDVLCNQVPVVFRRELYASVSLAVCLLFLGLRTLEVGSNLSTVVCFAGGLTLRLAAIRFKWRLPGFSYPQGWGGEFCPLPLSEPLDWLPHGTPYSPRF